LQINYKEAENNRQKPGIYRGKYLNDGTVGGIKIKRPGLVTWSHDRTMKLKEPLKCEKKQKNYYLQ